ncbi:hypothetical protein V8E55_001183 [Tylopilus felleus]
MSTEDTDDFRKLREKFGRFRILIMGRANAGKTTILRAICNTTENPEIFDGDGNKIDPSQVEGTREVSVIRLSFKPLLAVVDCHQRGIHDIENELMFRSNDKLVFHDSQGFEAGSEEEFLRMKKFIADRANTTILKKRIHAIWYCIPMDKHDRAIQRSEEKFFDELICSVPIVVLFTKFDALLTVAMGKLASTDRKLPLPQRRSKAEALIEGIFHEADIWGRLAQMKYGPKSNVRIGGMNKSYDGCWRLLEMTTLALDQKALQMMLTSAQEVNIALCVRCAVEDLISQTDKVHNSLLPISTISKLELEKLVWWFPHHRVSENFM